ncbi:hypothetical protein BX616_008523, partial [Lobosporangium transversale]
MRHRSVSTITMVVATRAGFITETDEQEELMEQGNQYEYQEAEEPDGLRMTRLREVLEKSLQETLKACNLNAICECFPLAAEKNQDALRDAHEKICQFLSIEVNNEFEQIIEERNVAFKLNGLDRLIADAKSKGITAGSRTLPDLSPEMAVRARTAPTKEAEIERLKALLEMTQLDNRRLGNALNRSSAEQRVIKDEVSEAFYELQE